MDFTVNDNRATSSASESNNKLIGDVPRSAEETKTAYKNLIKDKVLKPSKLSKYDAIKAHHSHLVIRDSHYLIKSPTSFITCASCHRGRVLKINTIKELSTEQILYEIYSTIGKNLCQKRRNANRNNQVLQQEQITQHSFANNLDSNHQIFHHQQQQHQQQHFHAQQHHQQQHISHQNQQNQHQSQSMSHNLQAQSLPLVPMVSLPNTYPSSVYPPAMGTSYSLPTSLPQLQASHQTHKMPSFEDLFTDFEPLQNLPQFAENMTIPTIGSTIKITSFTLASLFHAQSNFPANLDCFLSMALEQNFGLYTNDTLIVALPTYACTMFVKDPETNISHFRNDENLLRVLNTRIHNFVQQSDFNLQNLKIVIYFNCFNDTVSDKLHEPPLNTYVGNMYVLSSFQTMSDSSLTYTAARYAYNQSTNWIDPAEELAKNKLFNELVISKLQNEVFLSTNEVQLGTHINQQCFEKNAHTTVITFISDENFVVSAASSLFVVCYISVKLLRVLLGEDGLQMLAYQSNVHFNSKFHIYLLKLMLEQLESRRNVVG